MDLNKYIVTGDNSKSFHSSGLAKVANGDRMGSVAPESFSQRRQIDNNRRVIGAYNRSSIVNTRSVIRARPVIRQNIRPVKTARNNSTLQQHNSLAPPRPVRRSYDPYA